MSHPRDFIINQEPKERFLRYQAENPLGLASVVTPAEQEVRWCWMEIGALRSILQALNQREAQEDMVALDRDNENYDREDEKRVAMERAQR